MKMFSKSTSILGAVLAAAAGAAFTPANAQGDIYVLDHGVIGKYTNSGATINANLIQQPSASIGAMAVSGSDVYSLSPYSSLDSRVGEFTATGTPVNTSLITGLNTSNYPDAIAVSGSDVFVVNQFSGTVGEYTTSGSTVNADLISGLTIPVSIAVSGSDLFITDNGLGVGGTGTIGEYTTSGVAVNADLVSGLSNVNGAIVVSGSDIFVANGGTISEYTTAGETVNADLISQPQYLVGVAVSGSDIFVTGGSGAGVFEYTTSGSLVNGSLIPGLTSPVDEIVVTAATAARLPPSLTLVAAGSVGMFGILLLKRRRA